MRDAQSTTCNATCVATCLSVTTHVCLLMHGCAVGTSSAQLVLNSMRHVVANSSNASTRVIAMTFGKSLSYSCMHSRIGACMQQTLHSAQQQVPEAVVIRQHMPAAMPHFLSPLPLLEAAPFTGTSRAGTWCRELISSNAHLWQQRSSTAARASQRSSTAQASCAHCPQGSQGSLPPPLPVPLAVCFSLVSHTCVPVLVSLVSLHQGHLALPVRGKLVLVGVPQLL